jgi:hypothetical protein
MHTKICLKTEGTIPLGRPRRRLKDISNKDLTEIRGEVVSGFSWLGTGTRCGMLRTP